MVRFLVSLFTGRIHAVILTVGRRGHSEHLFICEEDEVSGKLGKLISSGAVRLSQLLRTSPLEAYQLQILFYDTDNTMT